MAQKIISCPTPPVGTIICTTSSTSPSAIYGGTWERYGQGRVLVSASDTDEDFTAGKTGGEKTHTMISAEIANHRHRIAARLSTDGNYGNGNFVIDTWTYQGLTNGDQRWTYTDLESGDRPPAPMNIMNPYIAVYMWRRTA